MSLANFLHKIGAWFDKVFNNISTDLAPVAVTITEGLKSAIDSGVLPSIISIIPNGIGEAAASWLKENGDSILNKILAVELGLEGMPANPTPDQVAAFANTVIGALAGSSAQAKSAIWTKTAAEFFTQLDVAVNASANGNLTFAQIVALIEQAYQDYQQNLSAAA